MSAERRIDERGEDARRAGVDPYDDPDHFACWVEELSAERILDEWQLLRDAVAVACQGTLILPDSVEFGDQLRLHTFTSYKGVQCNPFSAVIDRLDALGFAHEYLREHAQLAALIGVDVDDLEDVVPVTVGDVSATATEPNLEPVNLPQLQQAILDMLENADRPLTREQITGKPGPGKSLKPDEQPFARRVAKHGKSFRVVSAATNALIENGLAKQLSKNAGVIITPAGVAHNAQRRQRLQATRL